MNISLLRFIKSSMIVRDQVFDAKLTQMVVIVSGWHAFSGRKTRLLIEPYAFIILQQRIRNDTYFIDAACVFQFNGCKTNAKMKGWTLTVIPQPGLLHLKYITCLNCRLCCTSDTRAIDSISASPDRFMRVAARKIQKLL